MLLEAVRIVADWLEDATYGVSAKLTALPKDGGDTVTATIGVEDETRDDPVARRRVSEAATTILCAVSVSSQTDFVGDASEMRPIKRDHRVPILIRMRYVGEDSSSAVRDLYYAWRALGRSLEELQQNLQSAARTRNNTALVAIVADRGLPLWSSEHDKQVILAREIVVQMRDLAPQS